LELGGGGREAAIHVVSGALEKDLRAGTLQEMAWKGLKLELFEFCGQAPMTFAMSCSLKHLTLIRCLKNDDQAMRLFLAPSPRFPWGRENGFKRRSYLHERVPRLPSSWR
jgi:hypothetical protein